MSEPGHSAALGPSPDERGTNFAVFSSIAERVELCLFGNDGKEMARRDLERQDGGVWTDSRMYRPGCAHEDVRCLSALGAACQVATYAGFACLIVGVSWSADLFRKARDGYRRARRGGGGDAA